MRHPDRASVVGVAQPREARRARFAAEHGVAARHAAADWRQLADRGRLADAVLICTQDRMHAEPAEAFSAGPPPGPPRPRRPPAPAPP
jgi:predicted dehydrogenase